MAWDTDDLAALFDADMPGYRQATVGATVVDGVFRADPGDAFGAQVGGSTPQFRCATADLPTLTRGLAVIIDGVSYTVGDWDHLATGVTVIALAAA